MGFKKLKMCMVPVIGAAALGLVALLGGDSSTAPRAGADSAGAPAIAAYGGVLVPKRVRIILGFVQTLPA